MKKLEQNIQKLITEKFIKIMEKINNEIIPEDINYVYGDMLITDEFSIGKKEDVTAYIELQLATVDELYEKEVGDESDEVKEQHIDNWNKLLSELKEIKSKEVIMIKTSNKTDYIANDNETVKELKKIMVSIIELENPDINEEYRMRCQESVLGNLGKEIYDIYSQIVDKISFSTAEIMLAIEDNSTELLKELFIESKEIMQQSLLNNEITKMEYNQFIIDSERIVDKFEKYQKSNVEEEEL